MLDDLHAVFERVADDAIPWHHDLITAVDALNTRLVTATLTDTPATTTVVIPSARRTESRWVVVMWLSP